ncbi:MAG: energy transducer TonB [Bacteroidales bacterium]|jgi:protein TonB|nr:energy transducer TonB [Bacteroidales bacterium]
METKKTNRANLEKKRSLFFQIGLLLALSLAFVAFEWQMPHIKNATFESFSVSYPDIIIDIFPEPPPPPPPLPQSFDFQIVDNTVEVNLNDLFFDVENIVGNVWTELPPIAPLADDPDEDDIFCSTCTEEPPVFAGFSEYVTTHLTYPQAAIDLGISGTVYVQFVIDEWGNVTNPQLIRGIDPLLDNEALRLIENSPKWTPAKQRGKPVKVKFIFPVKFILQ